MSVAEVDSLFINTPFLQNIIDRTKNYLSAGYPVHFTGATGIGKTTLARHIAANVSDPSRSFAAITN